jgi:hypothetical protein
MNCELMLTYDTPALQQTGINVSQYINWNVFSNTFTRVLYFMFTDAIRTQTRPNQKLRVVGERNSGRRHIGQTPSTTDSANRKYESDGSKTLPTIWGTYMKLVTKYQISAINSC